MRYCFDPIGSFEVFHPKDQVVDPDTGQPLPSRYFEIVPAPTSADALKRQGWLFKPFEGGGGLYVEKIFRAGSGKTLRYELKDTISLDLLLMLNAPSLLNKTKPYANSDPSNPPALPPFNGLRRMLYFDNRRELTNPADDVIELSVQGDVSVEDFASLAPESYAYPLRFPNVSQLKLEELPIMPGGVQKVYDLNALSPVAVLDVPAGPWKTTRQPENESETLFLNSNLLPASYLALIRIIKLPTADWARPRRYVLHFTSV